MIEKAPSCEDPTDPGLLPVAEALQRIERVLKQTALEESETVAIADALNRILAKPVRSSIDVPSYTNSAMDGYAIHRDDIPQAASEKSLQVKGTAWAGRPLTDTISRGEAARIMTGAMMPQGTDTVVIQEHVEILDDGQQVRIDSSVEAGRNVRFSGEDVKNGEVVFEVGEKLGPAHIGQLASLGIPEVAVSRKLKVAYFTTGDELRSLDKYAGQALQPGELFDSNRHTLAAMLLSMGVETFDLGVVRDNEADTRAAFEKAAGLADVVITSGGVSTGEADYVTKVIHQLGDVAFWKLAMRPGRPLAFGTLGDAMFFGLPGNPVAVMVTFYEFVRPAMLHMMGAQVKEPQMVSAVCQSKLRKSPGRTEYQRGIVSLDSLGQTVVATTGKQGAGRITSMCLANCMIVLPPGSDSVEPGDLVQVQLFDGLI